MAGYCAPPQTASMQISISLPGALIVITEPGQRRLRDQSSPAPKGLSHRQTLRHLVEKLGNRFRLRDVNRMAAFRSGDTGIRTLGHQMLSGGRDHPIVSRSQIPARRKIRRTALEHRSGFAPEIVFLPFISRSSSSFGMETHALSVGRIARAVL
jgi:hypothetical protein